MVQSLGAAVLLITSASCELETTSRWLTATDAGV